MSPPGSPGQPVAGLPESGRALQPHLWSTIELWHRQEAEISGWEAARAALPAQTERWAELVVRLQMINTFQWHEEDRSRDRQADDATLAAVKRSIDASNGRRVRTVEMLDEHIHASLEAAGLLAPAAPPHSESPGSIVDRLSVLALKVYHVKEALAAARQLPGGGEDPALTGLYDRLRSLSEQMVDLTGCLDRLLDDLRAGEVSLKLYRQVKVYRDPASGDLDLPGN